MCHRAHAAASDVFARDSLGTTFSALIVGTFDGATGDTELCYVCHGTGALGSTLEVQPEFLAGPGHSVAPSASAYGPTPKQCSDCHDTHGSREDTSQPPPAALLRAKTTTDAVYSGNEYCGICHVDRPLDVFDGLSIFAQTRHAEITPTASGTSIVCSACHQPHGSSNPPLIVTELATPSAPATWAVTANDRWLCYGCHAAPEATYAGGLTYQTSTHGSSSTTVPALGEWTDRLAPGSAESSRAVGECQACHRPMGKNDGAGAPIDKLAAAEGKTLCYACHGFASTIATDMASMDYSDADGVLEVITGHSATASTTGAARLQVRSRLTTASTALSAPREFLQGRVGPVDTADIDGDTVTELLVARSGVPSVTVLSRSVLAGLAPDPGDVALLATADFMIAADILDDVNGLPEVVTTTGNTLRVYRWNGTGLGIVESTSTITGTITGFAGGNILGSAREEIVVTTNAPDQLYVVTGSLGSLTVNGPYASARSLPRGPSVGDLTGDGVGEIAVANAGEAVDVASIYNGAGSEIATASVSTAASQRAVSTVIGEVLTAISPVGTSGAELVVVRDDPSVAASGSRVSVFSQTAAPPVGFGAPQEAAIDLFSNPTVAAIGDVEGAGRPQIAVALAGQRPQETSAESPGLCVVRIQNDNATLGSAVTFDAAGAESAGSGNGGAWIAVADLGPVGPSRHNSGAVAGAHVSTETPSFARHVECSDCHNSHAATSTPAAAPLAYGAIRGAWGVAVDNAPAGTITLTEQQGIGYEYELCLKCHSAWSPSTSSRDIASEVDTRLASVHAIEASSSASQATPSSFVTTTVSWSNDSILHCRDCHDNANAGDPRGPHYSPQAPLVVQPFVGVASSSTTQLCFRCHRSAVYLTGTADGPANPTSTSLFYDQDIGARPALHSFHVQDREIGCEGCHSTHGSTREHLIRGDVGWTHDAANGGSCTNFCHTGGATRTYARP